MGLPHQPRKGQLKVGPAARRVPGSGATGCWPTARCKPGWTEQLADAPTAGGAGMFDSFRASMTRLAGGGGKAGALVDRATAELLLGADYGLNMEVVDCVKAEPST